MKKFLFTVVFVFMAYVAIYAQSRTVTGRITDDAGVSLAGISVQLKGAKSGTLTDANGNFSITVPVGIKNLIISGLNYTSQSVGIDKTNSVSVKLSAEVNSLNEVIVTGYAAKAVKDQVGSISRVSGEKISNEPVVSLDQALAGKTAGVQISLGSGILADRTGIRIRGVNSISSSSQPLIVIDGVPQITATNLNGFNGGNGTRFDPLALVDANDIESIEILKDAGASVLYGSRASNGVILITTKHGKKGSIKVNVDSKVAWARAANLPSLLNGDQFTTIMNEKASNRFGATAPILAKDSDIDGDGIPDRTNWNDYVYRTGLTYDNFISFSGGADKFNFYGSARYLTQEGITLGNKLTTGQAKMNLDFNPQKWFKAGMQLSYSRTFNNGILSDGYIAGTTVSGLQAPPNVSPFNKSGLNGWNLTSNGLLGNGNNVTSYNGTNLLPSASYYLNVLPQIMLQRNDNTAEQIQANIYGEIQPMAGLKLTTKFGLQYLNNFEDQYSHPAVNGLGLSYNGLVQDQSNNLQQWVWQNYITYEKTFASVHRISVIAGSEYQKNKLFNVYTGAANFSDAFFTSIIGGAYTNTIPGTTNLLDNTSGTSNASGIISYFGRLSYAYNNKYLLEGAIRRDGYSGFGANYQFGNFPSVSLGWVASKEKMLANVKWLNYLKLRGSYGTVGNSRGVGPYASLTLYSGGAYTSLSGLTISQAGNAGLRWETSKKTNFGFDATVLKSKVNITVDYFVNNVDNLILNAPVLYTTGIPSASITTNIGSMKNKGIEFTLNTTPVSTKNFSWSVSFNYTKIANEITSLVSTSNNSDLISGANVASVGRPLGSYFLPKWAGVDPQTGNPMWYSKDGTIKRYNFGATGTAIWTDDKGNPVAALGSADNAYINQSGLPSWYGGFSNNFKYKNFDLNIDFNYQGGNYIYNATLAGLLTNQFSNNYTQILSRWQKPGDVTNVPKLWLVDNTANQTSTRFLEKGDFLRCRTISLGYNIPRPLLKKINVDNVHFYVQVFNPFIITKYSGLDPDVSTSGTVQNNIQLGVDSRATPQSRIFTAGINVTF